MDQSAEQFKALKRNIYLVILPVIAVTVFLTFWLGREGEAYSPFDQAVLPFLAVTLLVAAGLCYWRKAWLEPVEAMLFGVLTFVYLSKLAYSMLIAYHQPSGASQLTQIYVWTPIIYAFTFLIFDTKRALTRSIAIFAATLGIGGVALSLGVLESARAIPERMVEFYLANAIVIMMLFVLSQLRGRVAELQTLVAKMDYLAHHDDLTGVPNRRQIELDLSAELERARRYALPLSVIMFDLDNFKTVNDTYGHAVGDEILKRTTRHCETLLRDSDRMGRWGGEEFLIIAPNSALPAARRLAERLRASLERQDFEHIGHLTASFGVASLQPEDDPVTLVKRADEALYSSKRRGRNRVEVVNKDAIRHLELPELYCPFELVAARETPQLQARTLEWLARYEVAPRPLLRRWVEGVNPGWLAAHIHHDAPLPLKQAVSDWCMWMFLHDDRCDESELGRSPARLDAVHGRLVELLHGAPCVPGDDAMAKMLADLRDRLFAASDEVWQARFTKAFEGYFAAVHWEASNRAQNAVPSLTSYLQMRLQTGGLPISDALLELTGGFRLPAEVREDASVKRIALVAANTVCWANDLFSLHKEVQRDDVHNLVLALQHAHRLSLQEAVDQAAAMHDAEVRNFTRYAESLPSFGDEADAEVRRYLDALRIRMKSNLVWSQASGRYVPNAPAKVVA